MELKLITDKERATTWFSKLHFKDGKFCNGLHMIEIYNKEIVYGKPIYVGTSILGLSKFRMMDFSLQHHTQELRRTLQLAILRYGFGSIFNQAR